MAVIGSRANGTRVPDDALKGGGFGAALFDSAVAPASGRRDVTYLGRPAPASSGPRKPARRGGPGAAPLDPRSSLFVAVTLDRVRREWLDMLDESETALDPGAAGGFADAIARRFGDFSDRTLAGMPEALRPHVENGLSRLGDELGARARDFETLASRVGVFNQAKQALDDLADTARHDRFDVARIVAAGRARIAAAPVSAGARAILEDYFLADLPLKVAQAHIDDDPQDALAAIERAVRRGGAADVADGVDPPEGASPAELYRALGPQRLGRLAARARVGAARARQFRRLEAIDRLERGIAENRVTPADLAAPELDDADRTRLTAALEAAEARERLTAEAVERFTADPGSLDADNGGDRTQMALAYSALAGIGDAGKTGMAGDLFRRTGFLPEPAVSDLRHIARAGSGEDAAGAAALLEAAGVPHSSSATPRTPG